MPVQLKLTIKKGGARGTEQATEVCEMLSENWQQFRDKYNALAQDEQDEMLEHFEGIIENLGDILFGEDSSDEDVKRFVLSQPDENQDAFAKAVEESLLIEEEQ